MPTHWSTFHITLSSCALAPGALHSPSQTQKPHGRFGSGVLHSATSSPAAKTRESKSSFLSRGELKSPTHTRWGGKLEINKGDIPMLHASSPYLLPSPVCPCLLSAWSDHSEAQPCRVPRTHIPYVSHRLCIHRDGQERGGSREFPALRERGLSLAVSAAESPFLGFCCEQWN